MFWGPIGMYPIAIWSYHIQAQKQGPRNGVRTKNRTLYRLYHTDLPRHETRRYQSLRLKYPRVCASPVPGIEAEKMARRYSPQVTMGYIVSNDG